MTAESVGHWLDTVCEQAFSYQEAEAWGDAGPLLERLVEVGSQFFGQSDAKVLSVRHCLALNHFQLEQYDKAIALFTENDAYNVAVFGASHPDTNTGRFLLARSYAEAGDFDRAIPLYERALKFSRQNKDEDHSHTWQAQYWLAEAYACTGRTHEAIPLYERCVAGRPLADSRTIMALTSLAVACHTLGDMRRAAVLYADILSAHQALGRPEDEVMRNLRMYLKRAKRGKPLPD
ncbi:tetratricopeptide repeat protein [Streptomyces mirabilis]